MNLKKKIKKKGDRRNKYIVMKYKKKKNEYVG